MRRRRSTDGGGSARHPASAPALALRVCRGGLVADVQRDRLQPRLLRCARLDSTTQRIQSRGHSPRTILYGRPTSSFHRRRAGVEARPYGGCLRRLTGNAGTPHRRYTNPSVTAQSAATAPLSGEPRAWAEVWGVYASVSHDADTYVAQPPVRGGVLDAPRSRDRRGGLGADGRRGQLQPRFLRCVRWRPPPNVCDFAGAARAPFLPARRRSSFTDAGRAWKPAPTVCGCVG